MDLAVQMRRQQRDHAEEISSRHQLLGARRDEGAVGVGARSIRLSIRKSQGNKPVEKIQFSACTEISNDSNL